MSVLKSLLDKSKWQEFLSFKINQSHLSKTEEAELAKFINDEKYLEIAKKIVQDSYSFSVPTKTLINKSGSSKKRVVYSFNHSENIILKFILFLMNKYDNAFSSNCYSFRKNYTVKRAFIEIVSHKNINQMFCYKLDISNYFNTINIEKLLPILHTVIDDDEQLFNLIKNILTQDKAIINGEIVSEKRGAMAGTSLSTFLANVYLMDLDKYFLSQNVVYARYSDDIIIFTESKQKLEYFKEYILNFLNKKDLSVNPEKESFFNPYEPWHFLGFEYNNGIIDLSKITIKKIKDKIRRKSRAIFRWKVKNNKTTEHAIKVLIRVFNNKFYRTENTKELSWCKWFFPLLSSHKGLKIIDDYFVQYLRYLSSGKFSRKNFSVTYTSLKKLGFRSLVNEFYKFKKLGHQNLQTDIEIWNVLW